MSRSGKKGFVRAKLHERNFRGGLHVIIRTVASNERSYTNGKSVALCFFPSAVSVYNALDCNASCCSVRSKLDEVTKKLPLMYCLKVETNHGAVNQHNIQYSSIEKPLWLTEVEDQRPWMVNLWCGFIGDGLVGPYFIE
nr:unnamed protein product [Callosobruchus chinensis]